MLLHLLQSTLGLLSVVATQQEFLETNALDGDNATRTTVAAQAWVPARVYTPPQGHFATKREDSTASQKSEKIKEMTELLDSILSKQDKKFRPDYGVKPVVVEVDINVRSMGPIYEQNREFSMVCYFRQRWFDRRLAFIPRGNNTEIPLESKTLRDIWHPDTYVRNGRRSYLHMLTLPNILLRVRSDGQVRISQRLTIRTRCAMFLKKFPIDTQACPIEIGSLGYYSDEVTYVWKDVSYDYEAGGNSLAQFNSTATYITHAHVTNPSSGRNVTVLTAYFKLTRQQGFYILQIYTPCTLLVVMSWVSFWINKEASPARVALGIMTVLSMSTLGFGIRTDLPKVSYSTALDIYIISCFAFVFAAMVEYAVINYAHVFYIRKQLHDLKGLDSNKAIDSMRLFTAGIMGARRETIQMNDDLRMSMSYKHIPWYKRIFRRDKGPNQSVFVRMAVKAAKAREKLKMRDPAAIVNRIDNVSKIAFPALYIIFNVIYWYAFLEWIPDEVDSLLHFENYKSLNLTLGDTYS